MGLRLSVVALAFDGGATATAAGATDKAQFEAWAGREASREGSVVSTLTEVELDGRPGNEWVARLCHDEGWSETLLVQGGGHRWAVPHTSSGHVPVCQPGAGKAGWRDSGQPLLLVDVGPGFVSEQQLAIIDQQVVVVGEAWSDGADTSDVRWDLASQRHATQQGRIIPVRLGNAVAPESGPTFVLQGAAQWSGLDDGELLAVAERRADGSVILRIAWRDDERRVGLAGDRLTLRWKQPGDAAPRGLDIRSDAQGQLRATALGGHALPPAVHGSVHRLEVVLPWRVNDPSEPQQMAMTIVAHDVDAGGTSVLATSEYDGSAGSLGELQYFPGGGDYLIAGRRLSDASGLDALPAPSLAVR